ncbi:MAG: formylglycine-generating enzyme family protein [Planctomycetota bacterium]|nr:formylglycine-generating enzyme family protein [Planctomycetota bacterium]
MPEELTLVLGKNVTMKLALIPAGKFMMGSPVTEKNREPKEGPQREVTISIPFYMGVYEVTTAQYEALMRKNPSNHHGAQNPVDTVSWNDAVEFCRTFSAKTDKAVRLPTEAEWEYACRAGTKTRFGYGDNDSDLGEYAWYRANSAMTTHPVGQKKPNAWGLYDMHGNVWEWCLDWFSDSYANAETRDPQGPASGNLRVLRGGSWVTDARFCRSAVRPMLTPSTRNAVNGFRVVVDSK